MKPSGTDMEKKEVITMKNRQYGWLVAVFISGYSGAAYEEFCETESEAYKVKEEAYAINDDVENVSIDEVLYDSETGEYVAA